MNRIMILKGLILVALATGLAIPVSAQQRFFDNERACLTAPPGTFQYYVNSGVTRLAYWQARVNAGTATLEELKGDLCADELTVDQYAPPGSRTGFRIVRLEMRVLAFFVNGVPVADGRCGNDFAWAQFVPKPEAVVIPPPPPADRKRQPPLEQVVLRPVPPPYTSVTRPQAKCVKFKVRPLDEKGKVLELTAEASDGSFLTGEFQTDEGRVIGTGNNMLISAKRLEKIFGNKPGTRTIRFFPKGDADPAICEGTIEIKRHGRFWLFYVPGFDCIYQAFHPKRWKGRDGFEKAACIAGAVGGIVIKIAEAGVVGFKFSVGGVGLISPP